MKTIALFSLFLTICLAERPRSVAKSSSTRPSRPLPTPPAGRPKSVAKSLSTRSFRPLPIPPTGRPKSVVASSVRTTGKTSKNVSVEELAEQIKRLSLKNQQKLVDVLETDNANRDDHLAQIRRGHKLKKVSKNDRSTNDEPLDLLAQIRRGHKLKKTQKGNMEEKGLGSVMKGQFDRMHANNDVSSTDRSSWEISTTEYHYPRVPVKKNEENIPYVVHKPQPQQTKSKDDGKGAWADFGQEIGERRRAFESYDAGTEIWSSTD